MSEKWIVVGISGATCSGKSTLAHKLHSAFPGSILINQDDYFHPVDSPYHVKVEALGHLNWEIMTSLDMNCMRSDVSTLLSQNPSSAVLPPKAKRSDCKQSVSGPPQSCSNKAYHFIVILEGFLLLNDPTISNVCDLRYYLTLTKDQCWLRRSSRVYDPPDIPGYFELVVWPEYEKHRDQVLSQVNMKVINGMETPESIFRDVAGEIQSKINERRISQN